MKIHICLYLNGSEVLNINDVLRICFLSDCVLIESNLNRFFYLYNEFDKIEVDYYD